MTVHQPEQAGDTAWSQAVRAAFLGAELTGLLAARSTATLSDAELVDALTARRRLANENEAAQLVLAEELYRRRAAADVGVGSTGPRHEAEVAARVGMELRVAWAQTRHRSERRLALARTLSGQLRGTGALLRAGRIDEYTASLIADELTQISDPALVAVAEEVLLDRLHAHDEPATLLLQTDTTKVRRLARLTLAQADPSAFDDRYTRAFATRRVTRQADGDGMARLSLTHTSIDIEAIHHRLTMIALGLGTDDPRTLDQRRADLVVDLLLGRVTVATGTADLEDGRPAHVRTRTGAGPRAQVNITVPIQTLMGVGDDPGTLPGGEPVPASLARQIAADPTSSWYRMLTDEAGNLLDLSTHTYRHTAPLARAIDARDQISVAPGSNTAATGCDHDHTIPAEEGGPTCYTNGGLLARYDHVTRHSPGFDLTQPKPGVFVWTMPTGHTWTTRPPPQPVGRWPQRWRQPTSVHQIQHGLDALDRQQDADTRAQIATIRRRIDEQRLRRWRHEAGDDLRPPAPPEHDGDHLDLTADDYAILAQAAAETLPA